MSPGWFFLEVISSKINRGCRSSRFQLIWVVFGINRRLDISVLFGSRTSKFIRRDGQELIHCTGLWRLPPQSHFEVKDQRNLDQPKLILKPSPKFHYSEFWARVFLPKEKCEHQPLCLDEVYQRNRATYNNVFRGKLCEVNFYDASLGVLRVLAHVRQL